MSRIEMFQVARVESEEPTSIRVSGRAYQDLSAGDRLTLEFLTTGDVPGEADVIIHGITSYGRSSLILPRMMTGTLELHAMDVQALPAGAIVTAVSSHGVRRSRRRPRVATEPVSGA